MSENPPTGLEGLPGAPPASDTAAWAPAGSKPAPTEAPYQPVAFDQKALTPIAKHELRQAINDGSREAYEAWAAKHAPDGQQLAEAADAAPAVDPAKAEGAAADPLTARLAEYGLDHSAVEAFDEPSRQWAERLDGLPDAERGHAIAIAEEHVLKHLHGGSESAMAAAVAEIGKAAVAMGLNLDAVNQSGLLADWRAYTTALGLARQINGRRS